MQSTQNEREFLNWGIEPGLRHGIVIKCYACFFSVSGIPKKTSLHRGTESNEQHGERFLEDGGRKQGPGDCYAA